MPPVIRAGWMAIVESGPVHESQLDRGRVHLLKRGDNGAKDRIGRSAVTTESIRRGLSCIIVFFREAAGSVRAASVV